MNRILIDTHVLLWWLAEPNRLKAEHIELIENPYISVEVSVCSLFEITIKKASRKLIFEEDFEEILKANDFRLLPLDYSHLRQYATLPGHHKDPFDRMLIAQAISENMSIISYDSIFRNYPVDVV